MCKKSSKNKKWVTTWSNKSLRPINSGVCVTAPQTFAKCWKHIKIKVFVDAFVSVCANFFCVFYCNFYFSILFFRWKHSDFKIVKGNSCVTARWCNNIIFCIIINIYFKISKTINFIFKGSVNCLLYIIFRKRFKFKNSAPWYYCTSHWNKWIFSSCSDKNDITFFNGFKHRIWLSLAPPVTFIKKEVCFFAI